MIGGSSDFVVYLFEKVTKTGLKSDSVEINDLQACINGLILNFQRQKINFSQVRPVFWTSFFFVDHRQRKRKRKRNRNWPAHFGTSFHMIRVNRSCSNLGMNCSRAIFPMVFA
jgi:hypothetical protein